MKLLGVIGLVTVLAFCAAEDPEDPPDEFQCHILYEYDASVKGEVTSPYYEKREKYYDGLWCEGRIRAPEGYRIKITFKDLDIVPSTGCAQDQLVLYSKDKESVLGVFCGTELPYPLLSKEGENEIRFLFYTDYIGAGKGFVLQYESAPDMEPCNPGFTLCKNRNCYDSRRKCDGTDDCGDGSDEEDCGFPIVLEPDKCGEPAITPKTYFSPDRMVGGERAIPNSWPWQVSLQFMISEPNGHFCGGALINAQWVLTASHCVAGNYDPPKVKIHVGSHYKFKKTKYEQIRTGIKIIAYPDLEFEKIRSFTFNDDITLIKLNAPVKFNDGVQPACLPQLGWKVQPGMSCIATGWGETRGSGWSDELKQIEQIIRPKDVCNYWNEATQFCGGKLHNAACHGDSGGPLQCNLGGKWFVFGVTSFATDSNMLTGLCTGSNATTVYANVADKIDWIKKIINKFS